MSQSNAYAILGVSKGISDRDLKLAYVNLVKKYDPERHTERFMVIQQAYDKLKNQKTRAKEDIFTYNPPKGEYMFNDDEKCLDGQVPSESEVADMRRDFHENVMDENLRVNFLKLLIRRAHCMVVRKQLSDALRDWMEVLESEPSHIRTRHNLLLGSSSLALSYAMHGLLDEAIELWERALQLNPDDTDLMHNLALVCEKARDARKAGKYWTDVVGRWKAKLARDPGNEYLTQCIVEALQHHGEDVPAFEAPANPLPSKVVPRHNTAPPMGHASAHRAAQQHHQQPPAAQKSGTFKLPKIVDHDDDSISPEPGPGAAGAANVPRPSTSTPPPAPLLDPISRARQIAELKPEDFDAHFSLANALMEARQFAEAQSTLEALGKKHPKNTEILNTLGWALLNQMKKDDAFNAWRRALVIDPKNAQVRESMVRAHLTLGKLFRDRGQFTPAMVHFKQLLSLVPRSVEVLMEIAATYDMKGDVRQAALSYEQVLAIDPKHKDARKAYNDLRMKR